MAITAAVTPDLGLAPLRWSGSGTDGLVLTYTRSTARHADRRR
jgi:hypothetical protein